MFRKATLSDLDAISSIYDAIHGQEEAGLSTTGWVRSIYPTRATAEQSIQIGDMPFTRTMPHNTHVPICA